MIFKKKNILVHLFLIVAIICIFLTLYWLYHQDKDVLPIQIELPESPINPMENNKKISSISLSGAATPSVIESLADPALKAWTLQLTSFEDEALAKDLMEQLKNKNMTPYIKEKENRYTVYVGPELNHSFLVKQLNLLKDTLNIDGAIIPLSQID